MTLSLTHTAPTSLPRSAAPAGVTVQGLSKRYDAKHVALSEVSFEARPGEIYGILGPNGAGKTTTLRILATLLTPSSGSATVAGYDIVRQPQEVRRHIGVVNGGMGVYDRLTGREILEYFAGFYGLGAREIRTRIEVLSNQLEMDALLDRRASEYSTGMKQKIVIARAVLHQPQVLILDEATSGLDILARRAVLDFARTYRAEGKTVLYSTHILHEAEELCDRAALIVEGRVRAEGTLECLKGRSGAHTLEEAFFDLLRGPDPAVFRN